MPCQKRMPVRANDEPGSGCRRDCLHRALVKRYRSEKGAYDEARKLEREEATHGFATEGTDWDEDHPSWGFREFLVQSAAGLAPEPQSV